MQSQDIKIIARYESKIITRSILWKISVLLVLGSMAIILYPRQHYGLWNKIALDSSIAFQTLYYLNIIQTFILVFICTDKKLFKRHHQEVIAIYPFDNKTLLSGHIGGIIKSFLYLDFFIMGIMLTIQCILTPILFNPDAYIFYFITLTLPTFIFILGISIWLNHIFKHSFLSLITLLVFLVFTYLFLPDYFHGSFDLWGRTLPNSFSTITGHVNIQPYLLHRFAYFISGIGFLYLTISRINRIPNYVTRKNTHTVKGIICIFLGLIAISLYMETFNTVKRTRTTYRDCFSRYQNTPYVIPLTYDITFQHHGKSYSANSQITLHNPSAQKIEKTILFLNPKLKITNIKHQEQSIPFQRDNQAIIIRQSLQSNEKITLSIDYQGSIDENICYLDIPDNEFYDSRANSHLIQRHGRHFAYVTPDYLLLHPECLWYPVSTPPVNHITPLAREVHFSDFHLKVKHTKRNTIISQGKREKNTGYTTFTPEQSLPGISLCIGNYRSRTMTIDSVELELYYLPGSHFIIDKFYPWDDSPSAPMTETIDRIKSLLGDSESGKKYPFHRFTLIETPVSFCSYLRWWKDESLQTQPSLAFLPERGATLHHMPLVGHKKFYISQNYTDDIEFQNNIIMYIINSNLRDWKVNWNSQLDEFTCFISSQNYPGINNIVKRLLDLKDRSNVYTNYYTGQEEVIAYLARHSLLEAITISPPNIELPTIFNKKIIDLQAYLSIQIPWTKIHSFFQKKLSEYQFQTIDFKYIQQEFQREFNIDIAEILNEWYTTASIPTLLVKDIKFMQTDPSDPYGPYKMHLKVYNPSPTDGILTVYNKPISIYKDMVIQSYRINAGECKELKEIYDYSSYQGVSTNLSQNMPDTYKFELQHVFSNQAEEYTQDTICGIFDTPPDPFHPAPGEIIIDNLDPGFSLIHPRFEKLAALFKTKKAKRFSNLSGNLSRWKEIIQEEFHGDAVKSAFCKEVGTGKYKATWNINIPRTGRYEIHFYLPSKKNCNTANQGNKTKLFYTVQQDKEYKEIIIDADGDISGWISLGEFNFTRNEISTVILDDRGGSITPKNPSKLDETFPTRQIIIADAVKWTFIK